MARYFRHSFNGKYGSVALTAVALVAVAVAHFVGVL